MCITLSEVHLQHICFRLAFTKCLLTKVRVWILFGSQLGENRTLNIMLLSGHMSNANALYDQTDFSFLPKLLVEQFRPALAICHLSFDEHLSWEHRADILTNSCHIISSLVGTVSNIVFCSDDQRIDSVQVCKFGRRATVTILPKLHHLLSAIYYLLWFWQLGGKAYVIVHWSDNQRTYSGQVTNFGPLHNGPAVN